MNGAKSCYDSSFSPHFSVKVPMAPIHIWLLGAHVEVLRGGFVIFARFSFKLGTPHGP